jgi:hypothetical protein
MPACSDPAEEALRALLEVKPGVKHSVHRGMTLMTVRCEGCGAVMTEQRRLGGKLWMYCPNDPAFPPDLIGERSTSKL